MECFQRLPNFVEICSLLQTLKLEAFSPARTRKFVAPSASSFPEGMKTRVQAKLKLQVGNQTSTRFENRRWCVCKLFFFL